MNSRMPCVPEEIWSRVASIQGRQHVNHHSLFDSAWARVCRCLCSLLEIQNASYERTFRFLLLDGQPGIYLDIRVRLNVAVTAALSISKCLPATTERAARCTMATLGSAVCVWTDRFPVKFVDDYLSYGAFRIARIVYKDMVSARLSRASRGGH